MRATSWVVGLLALGMVVPCLGVVGASPGIGVGAYWEYKVNADLKDAGSILNDTSLLGLPSMNVSAIARLSITSKTTESIGSVATDVLVGKANVSIPIPVLGYVIGAINVNASANFVESTFEMSSFTMVIDMSLGIPGFGAPIHYSMGASGSMSPPFDYYPGDHDLTANSRWTGNSSLTVDSWSNTNGTNQSSGPMTQSVSSTFEVAQTGVSVTVPAGTFTCTKIQLGGALGTVPVSLYYSDQAHFFVKMVYGNSTGSMTASLKSYSVGGGVALTQGTVLAVGGIAVVIVAAIVIALLLLRRRGGRAPAQVGPPMQPGYAQGVPPPDWPNPYQPGTPGPPGPPGPPIGGS